jgi:hypothetical protein
MKQEFKNNPRFTLENNQKLREKMAQAREKMQRMTAGIYPESDGNKKEEQKKEKHD